LIEAARELFAAHGFSQVSTKRIAEAAGLNPAMIRYHFKDKAGLLEASFREAITPVIDTLGALASSGSDDGTAFRRLFAAYMQTLAANPWLPQMVVRHVLPEGGRLQGVVLREVATKGGPAIAALIHRGQQRRELRCDLDPVLTTLSVVSLALFPFLSLPVTGRVFKLEIDAAFVAALVDHTTTLFHRGAGVDPRSEQ
jgi:AcrR family transcriptional regulator